LGPEGSDYWCGSSFRFRFRFRFRSPISGLRTPEAGCWT
jgi:hypothetical protein